MKRTSIAIIGFGPRGLSIFERIIAYVSSLPESSIPLLDIHIFDTNLSGSGCHDSKQNDYLLVNTVANQITHFSDDSVIGAGPLLPGPSFFEWLKDQKNIPVQDDISPDAYYPRFKFGMYLNWVYRYLLSLAPKQLNIVHHKTLIDDISPYGANSWRIFFRNQFIQDISFVFLTTGHSRKKLSTEEISLEKQVKSLRTVNPLLDIIYEPYPIKKNLALIDSKHTVAIEGAGLTAFDIIAELTLGRGGRFCREGNKCIYIPSKNEPNIVLFSRSGLPLTARAKNQKGSNGQYKAKFLTLQKIKEIKIAEPNNKLDFVQQILPLLILDMSYVYYFALIKKRDGICEAMKFCHEFVRLKDDQARNEFVALHIESKEQFSWDRLVNPISNHALKNQSTFQSWLFEYLLADLHQASQGNIDSPVKAACDVLRDLRDTLRYAIDLGGLTEKSHRWLIRDFVPVMNRLAVGPPLERIEELIALMEAGIVKFDFGPSPTCTLDEKSAKFIIASQTFSAPIGTADVLIQARMALPGPLEDASPLMQRLINRGIVRPFANGDFYPGGIQVNQNLNVVNKRGEVFSSLWALGIPTEGCKFYTFVVPRPGVNSTAILDAGKIVMQMMKNIDGRSADVSLFNLNIA